MRIRTEQSGYTGGFIEHYLIEVIYPCGPTREVQFMLAAAVVVINIAIYAWIARRGPIRHGDA